MKKIKLQNISENPIVTFNNGKINLDVRVSHEEETVWMSQNDISKLLLTSPITSPRLENAKKILKFLVSSTDASYCIRVFPGTKNRASKTNTTPITIIGILIFLKNPPI